VQRGGKYGQFGNEFREKGDEAGHMGDKSWDMGDVEAFGSTLLIGGRVAFGGLAG
jgi:hypothetical protein